MDDGQEENKSIPEIRIVECEDQSEFAVPPGAGARSNPDLRLADFADVDAVTKSMRRSVSANSVVYRRGSTVSVHSEIVDLRGRDEDE